jgi:1-deoxy-D-xylulose-5-phosphate synthase
MSLLDRPLLLDRIAKPADLRKLSMDELAGLCAECRELIFRAVSRNGGHLASNLGIVELLIALHYVYDFGPYPQGPDRLLFDVGHQCYVHKIVTGRAEQFDTLRKKGSISGFPNPLESAHDLFAVGHAGTCISTALGMAMGDAAQNRNSRVVAVVGDGSVVNGMSFEGLNHVANLKRQLLVVLNDNGMSISKPQGALATYLERVRISTTYDAAKHLAQKMVNRLPTGVGHTIEAMWHHMKEGIKSGIWPGRMFEPMGLKYLGPLDGHDLPGLIQMLAELKDVPFPILLHVKTVKGKGYEAACNEPTKFHSPSGFKVEGDQIELIPGNERAWTNVFSRALIGLARSDKRIVALTAAMPDGTGLAKFEKEFPTRFHDVGICESHLIGLAAGMCKAGMRPVAAIYSTFTQRAFDQFWQEVVLNGLPVVLCMDRAGFVGDDGAVHHGFMDLAFLRPLPGIVLMSPSDSAEMKRALELAFSIDAPVGIRYPRDAAPEKNFEETIAPHLSQAASLDWQLGKSRTLREGTHATLIAYGSMALQAMAAAAELEAEGISATVVDARFCKPLDGEMIARALRSGQPVLTIEDHSLQNGFGSAILEYAVTHGLSTERITRLGMPDRLVAHATRQQQLAEVGLDAAGIARSTRDAIRSAKRVAVQVVPVLRELTSAER